MSKLVCGKCGVELKVPVHCGKEMHLEENQLVCWMGPTCGSQKMPSHCGQVMKIKS